MEKIGITMKIKLWKRSSVVVRFSYVEQWDEKKEKEEKLSRERCV